MSFHPVQRRIQFPPAFGVVPDILRALVGDSGLIFSVAHRSAQLLHYVLDASAPSLLFRGVAQGDEFGGLREVGGKRCPVALERLVPVR